jgi:rod shape-determining protein MreC
MNKNRTLIILIVLNFFIFFYGTYNQVRLNFGEQFLYSLSKPFLLFNYYITNTTNSLKEELKSNLEVRKEMAQLKEENLKLKERLIRFESLKNENINLKKILEIDDFFDFKKLNAKVIGGSNALYQSFIVVDKGANCKIQNGEGVINIDGVVGLVVDTFATSSKVLLLTDPLFQIDTVLISTNQHGILMGNNKNCIVKFLPNNKIYKNGDLVITSGLNYIFPYGIPVGYVSKVIKKQLYTEVVVTPFVNKYSLNYVVLLRKN